MKRAIIEIDSMQLLNALEQLPPQELKSIIDELFLKGLLKKPDFEDISRKAREGVEKEGLKPEIVEESIKWARK